MFFVPDIFTDGSIFAFSDRTGSRSWPRRIFEARSLNSWSRWWRYTKSTRAPHQQLERTRGGDASLRGDVRSPLIDHGRFEVLDLREIRVIRIGDFDRFDTLDGFPIFTPVDRDRLDGA